MELEKEILKKPLKRFCIQDNKIDHEQYSSRNRTTEKKEFHFTKVTQKF